MRNWVEGTVVRITYGSGGRTEDSKDGEDGVMEIMVSIYDGTFKTGLYQT